MNPLVIVGVLLAGIVGWKKLFSPEALAKRAAGAVANSAVDAAAKELDALTGGLVSKIRSKGISPAAVGELAGAGAAGIKSFASLFSSNGSAAASIKDSSSHAGSSDGLYASQSEINAAIKAEDQSMEKQDIPPETAMQYDGDVAKANAVSGSDATVEQNANDLADANDLEIQQDPTGGELSQAAIEDPGFDTGADPATKDAYDLSDAY